MLLVGLSSLGSSGISSHWHFQGLHQIIVQKDPRGTFDLAPALCMGITVNNRDSAEVLCPKCLLLEGS